MPQSNVTHELVSDVNLRGCLLWWLYCYFMAVVVIRVNSFFLYFRDILMFDVYFKMGEGEYFLSSRTNLLNHVKIVFFF